MELRKIDRDPSRSEFRRVADLFVAEDYDAHTPPRPSDEFARFMKEAITSSDAFGEWVRRLQLE